MVLLHGAMERSETVLPGRIDVCAGGNEDLYGLAVAPAANDMQWSVAIAVPIVNGVYPVLEEIRHSRDFRKDVFK